MSGTPEMGTETATLVLEWLAARGGDRERTARYMRDALRIGGVPECRELIEAALVVAYGADYMRQNDADAFYAGKDFERKSGEGKP